MPYLIQLYQMQYSYYFFENLSGKEDFYQPIKINFDHRAQNSSSSQRSEGQSNNSLTCLVGGPKQSEKKKKH